MYRVVLDVGVELCHAVAFGDVLFVNRAVVCCVVVIVRVRECDRVGRVLDRVDLVFVVEHWLVVVVGRSVKLVERIVDPYVV